MVPTALVRMERIVATIMSTSRTIRGRSLYFMTMASVLSRSPDFAIPAPITNIAAIMMTFLFVSPENASVIVMTLVSISAMMMPMEITVYGSFPDMKAMIVRIRIISTIVNWSINLLLCVRTCE